MGPNCAAALRPDGQTSKLQTSCGCPLTWSLRGHAWVTVKKNWACRECANEWGPCYAASKWMQVNDEFQCTRCVPKALRDAKKDGRPPVPPIPATAAASSGSGAAAAPKAPPTAPPGPPPPPPRGPPPPPVPPMAPPEPTPTREQATAMSGEWFEQHKQDASVGTSADMMFRFVRTADASTDIQSGEHFAQEELDEGLRNFNFGNM